MFNNPNRNCILLSPGRTGSTLIFTFLSKITRLFPNYRQHYDNQKPMCAKQILHSHEPKDVNLSNEHTFFVLSTRNMIDSTYSRIIGDRNQKYQYYGNANKYAINSFTIDKSDFERAYEYSIQYYTTLKDYLPDRYVRVDYSEFCDNPLNLLTIFNIHENTYKFFTDKNLIPIKTPGTYQDYIINFDEINEYAKTFDPNPPI